jgi:UDP-3-O-[3-hydroxymyristoyl] glucosamine N-acyltransferase
MKKFRQSLTPEVIHRITGGELMLRQSNQISNIADALEAGADSVIFLDNDNFLSLVMESKTGLILASTKYKNALNEHPANLIVVENAYHAVLRLIHFWQEGDKAEFVSKVHPTVVLGNNVILPEHISIGAYVVIGDDVTIGDYTTIDSFCSIGNNTVLGHHCRLYPNVSLYEETTLGNNVILHAGTVIGADGFGYLMLEGIQQKIPQIGNVIIHDNVEIGANSAVDRGTIGTTIIGEGTKIDNLCQIGHNCIIGKHSILCAQVGLAGSTTIGDYVFLAGQVGVAGHLKIGDAAMVGAQSGVAAGLESGKKYFGTPARDAMLVKKIIAIENSLPDMYKFYQKLKKEKEQE